MYFILTLFRVKTRRSPLEFLTIHQSQLRQQFLPEGQPNVAGHKVSCILRIIDMADRLILGLVVPHEPYPSLHH
jgi:hypothetical protein